MRCVVLEIRGTLSAMVIIMKAATQVQILDEAFYISPCSIKLCDNVDLRWLKK